MNINTHLDIDRVLCGEPILLSDNVCIVTLHLTERMRADSLGLVHGGFIFGAADYAAMLAVNEPNVVLGNAEVRFVQPSRVGETLRFEARVVAVEGKQRKVVVNGSNESDVQVFHANFYCFVPAHHVLRRS